MMGQTGLSPYPVLTRSLRSPFDQKLTVLPQGNSSLNQKDLDKDGETLKIHRIWHKGPRTCPLDVSVSGS